MENIENAELEVKKYIEKISWLENKVKKLEAEKHELEKVISCYQDFILGGNCYE